MENDFLLGMLVPWLSCLNIYCMPSKLRKYVDQNQIGSSPLAANDPLLLYMMWGMDLSVKNVGVHYNVLGVPDLIVLRVSLYILYVLVVASLGFSLT